MQYTKFAELYPFLNTRLIEWASARIAGTSEYLEAEVRSRITYLNWKLNDRRINAPITKRFLAEFPNGVPVSGIDEALAGDEEFRYLNEQLLEAKYNLSAIKATTTTPTQAQKQQAVEEVKDYITALHSPSVDTFLQWNQRLSGREKHFIQSIPQLLRRTEDASSLWLVASTEWGYLNIDGYSALSEPVLKSFFDKDRLIGAITTNSYGVKVLNTPTTMFVDVDFDTDDVPLECLPWGKQPKGMGIEEQIAEIKFAIAKTTKAWGLRFELYRTFNGLRLIELSREWDAQNLESTTVLEALGCDRLFQQLCETQGTFRARLEPKPWRETRNCHSVCHAFGSYGVAPVNPVAARVKLLHDAWCLGTEDLA
jgi:hypothetical protein